MPSECAAVATVGTQSSEHVSNFTIIGRRIFSADTFVQGIRVMTAGAALALLRSAFLFARHYVWERCTVTIQVDSKDLAFNWLATWLASQPYSKSARSLTCTSSISQGDTERIPRLLLSPAPGKHLLKHHGRWLWLERSKTSSGSGSFVLGTQHSSGGLGETMTLTLLGRDRDILKALIMEAWQLSFETERNRTTVYLADQYGNWKVSTVRPLRPLESVVLPIGIGERLLADCTEFFESEDWYSSRGIPYRRGYLLHGLPGTGKTSFVTALAGSLRVNIYVINLSSPTLTDALLIEFFTDAPQRCILLLEDVDSAFTMRTSGAVSSGLTFSGLLNAIDGVAAQEGRLLFMTTNHIEKLDPALIRPGRIDVIEEFGPLDMSQTTRLFQRYYTNATLDEAQSFARALLGDERGSGMRVVTPSRLQGFLMQFKHDHAVAIAALPHFIEQLHKSENARGLTNVPEAQ